MKSIFNDMIGHYMEVYIDDIIILSLAIFDDISNL